VSWLWAVPPALPSPAISASGLSSGARRHHAQSQEAAAHLPRRRLEGAPQEWPQTGIGDACADDSAARAEPALVTRLRIRCLHMWPPVPYPLRDRRVTSLWSVACGSAGNAWHWLRTRHCQALVWGVSWIARSWNVWPNRSRWSATPTVGNDPGDHCGEEPS
jgi:hypothetical protein